MLLDHGDIVYSSFSIILYWQVGILLVYERKRSMIIY